ncbi:MAG: Macrolide export ATP-binding/permease protein MacB [Chlamydiae bacterium]|nr:Macrolide export ATP-binding/permease protein MacB [Chlamydiota bacterium]
MRACIQSLMMHKFRSFLSVLGVLIGVASLITMLSIGEGTKQESLEQIESLGIHNIYLKSVGKKPIGELPDIPGITLVVPISRVNLRISASLKDIHPEILMTATHLQHILNLDTQQGRFLCDMDSTHKQKVCVIGAEVSQKLGPKGTVGQTLRIGNSEHLIVGVLSRQTSTKKKGKAFSDRDYNQTILVPFSSNSVSEMILKVQDKNRIPQMVAMIRKVLSDREDVQLVIPQELLRQSEKSQRMFNLVLGLIAATSLLVGGIGIANVMMASVYERIVEIGIRRAVGATQADILKQFLGESLLLTVGGTIMGIILGGILSIIVSFISDWTTVITLWSIVLSFIMAVIVGVCAGVYPALQASRVDPIIALRS